MAEPTGLVNHMRRARDPIPSRPSSGKALAALMLLACAQPPEPALAPDPFFDPEPRVRLDAVWHIERSAEAVQARAPDLQRLAREDEDLKVRYRASEALRRHGLLTSEVAIPVIEAAGREWLATSSALHQGDYDTIIRLYCRPLCDECPLPMDPRVTPYCYLPQRPTSATSGIHPSHNSLRDPEAILGPEEVDRVLRELAVRRLPTAEFDL